MAQLLKFQNQLDDGMFAWICSLLQKVVTHLQALQISMKFILQVASIGVWDKLHGGGGGAEAEGSNTCHEFAFTS